jgi:putative membrane protein
MDILSAIQPAEVAGTVFYTILGVAMMWLIWKLVDWMTPFSVMKEIEHDQNVALAVLVGMLFVAVSIIIAAVILS